MLKKRIIPCLDIKNGRTVKGINFVNLKDAGNPVLLAEKYANQGADELVFLDITATVESREILLHLVKQIANKINIPFTVGGGIKTLKDARAIIRAGADKISINSAAVNEPLIISSIAKEIGSQSLVVAIDTKLIKNTWWVFTHGGRKQTALKTIDWAKKAASLGAGEILLTSMNNDGMKQGYSLNLTNQISNAIEIPLIASGGAGNKRDFKNLFQNTSATGALAASLFHFDEVSIPTLKQYLVTQNIPIRL